MSNKTTEMPTNPSSERLALRVAEYCSRVGISRASFYKYVKRGEIRIVKIAGRTLVPASEFASLSLRSLHD